MNTPAGLIGAGDNRKRATGMRGSPWRGTVQQVGVRGYPHPVNSGVRQQKNKG